MHRTLGIALAVIVLALATYAGSRYLANGLGSAALPQQHLIRYSSEEGVTFEYPDSYVLSSRTEGSAERRWDVLVLMPKGATLPQNGEGPPAITVGIYPNPEGLTLEQWVHGDARSNWKLIIDDRASTTTTVGDVPALWYHYSGLYEVDSVATVHGGKVFLFSVDWLDPQDTTREDFNRMLDTVTFIQ